MYIDNFSYEKGKIILLFLSVMVGRIFGRIYYKPRKVVEEDNVGCGQLEIRMRRRCFTIHLFMVIVFQQSTYFIRLKAISLQKSGINNSMGFNF